MLPGIITGIAAIIIFLTVILIHELGHFIVAKKVGVKVNEFSIGMGPQIFQKNKKETTYSFRLIPLGGYVSMEGEDEDSDDPRSFNNAKVTSKIAIVAAGAIMNFILAIIVLSIVSYGVGVPNTKIESVIEASPASYSGLAKGDKITKINGVNIETWDDIINEIGKAKSNQDLEVEADREGKTSTYTIKPTEEDGRTIIGIVPMRDKSVSKSIEGGFKQTIAMIKTMFLFISMLISGKLGTDSLAGPVGVIEQIGTAARMGIYDVLFLLGFISVNLGFFNLLPIPALDGGRIFFLLIEAIRGKKINPDKEGMIHFVGFILLISLMLFVTYKDILRLIF